MASRVAHRIGGWRNACGAASFASADLIAGLVGWRAAFPFAATTSSFRYSRAFR